MRRPLWKPSKDRVEGSNISGYIRFVNDRFDKKIQVYDYDELYKWSVDNPADFWASVWEFTGVRYSRNYDSVIVDGHKMPGAGWFAGARLNFAENLLKYGDDLPAIIFRSESGLKRELSYAYLRADVARLAGSMRNMGIKPLDRIAAFMPNIPETVAAMLASAGIGAMWSSCSPDFGVRGVLDRFSQIEPRLLFVADGYGYNGRYFNSLEKVEAVIDGLPSVEKVVVVPYIDRRPDTRGIRGAVLYKDFLAGGGGADIPFEQLPFEHPLYIMYSSGTTGLPKCMVQGAGGVLINHLKELILHTDLKREDRIFYFTTCGWMMWNWLISSLAVGAAVVLFDGSPFYPDAKALFRLAEEAGITIFGTSAKYIAAVKDEGLRPVEEFDLSRIKTILSTGSPLAEESFDYVYRHVKKDVCLSSIAGGTDLNGCFFLGNPILPVYRGEIQCRGLGMKVEAFDKDGRSIIGREGELVCTAPFPSMPLYFWNDEDGRKYHEAYFNVYPNVWCHGDYIRITAGGGVIMLGRSDATLNPGGVRIGTSELYGQIGSLAEIKDSLVVGQKWKGDERVILFVKLADGAALTEELKAVIKKRIKENVSPRHVPAKIIEVADIPYTINMKKVEMAVKNIINGRPVANRDSLANPASLDLYTDISELKED